MIDIDAFAKAHAVSDIQLVRVLREQFPGHDKYLYSKLKKPDTYGIRLLDSAEKLLESAFADVPPAPRKKVKRRRQPDVRCSLSGDEKVRLQQAFERLGYDTTQDGMRYLIQTFLVSYYSKGESL